MVIELKNEYLTVQFSRVGGSLSSIKDNEGVEYLWQGNPTYWSGQAPALFPICGSLRNDTAVYNHKNSSVTTGHIPRHGLVRKKEFEYKQLSHQSISFSISSDEEMLTNYPYSFHLEIVYTLDGKSIKTEYRVTNNETESVMPYFIGGHPGFNCPLLSSENYTDYYLEFETAETCTVPKQFPETGLLDLQDRSPFLTEQRQLDLNFDLFSYDAITLDQLQSRSVSLKSRKHSKGVCLEFNDFPYLILWSTVNKGPFIALEPWSGLSTSLEEKDTLEEKLGVTLVKEKQVSVKSFSITII